MAKYQYSFRKAIGSMDKRMMRGGPGGSRKNKPHNKQSIQTPVSSAQFLENMGQAFSSKSNYDINKILFSDSTNICN